MIRRIYLIGVVGLFLSVSLGIAKNDPTADGKQSLSFSICFKDEVSSLRILAIYIMPSETVEIEVCDFGLDEAFLMTSGGEQQPALRKKAWLLKGADSASLSQFELTRNSSGELMRLNLITMVPFNSIRDGSLNGYRIGDYPAERLRGLSIYDKPRGFVEVTAENQETFISPHFRLRQFLCKQPGNFPKYVVLRERLLLKLEALLSEVQKAGIPASTFTIMSGYRTPFYNKAIKNVPYSRHLWGGAADIFIDEDGDGQMDDLNRDGKIDYHDAEVLRQLVDRLSGLSWYERFLGGLAKYRRKPTHGPFVHVDVRGNRVRW